jgi:hypothetical protein
MTVPLLRHRLGPSSLHGLQPETELRFASLPPMPIALQGLSQAAPSDQGRVVERITSSIV